MKNDWANFLAGMFVGTVGTAFVLSHYNSLPRPYLSSIQETPPSPKISSPKISSPKTSQPQSLDLQLTLPAQPTTSIHTSLALDDNGTLTTIIDRIFNSSQPSLDELLSDYKIKPDGTVEYTQEGRAKDLQQIVDGKIMYIPENRTDIYPQLGKNESQYLPMQTILTKKAGDCKDGFVVMANLLHQQGYLVQGLAVNPHNGKPGHIVAVYQDPDTKFYGTAGLSNEDFTLPVYKDLETIAKYQALKQGWNTATAETVDITPAIQSGLARNGTAPFTLPRTVLTNIDLEQEYGISFNEHEESKGKINVEMDKEGYVIRYDGLLIPKAAVLHQQLIEHMYFSRDPNFFYISIGLKEDDRFSYSITAFLDPSGKINVRGYKKHDRSKVTNPYTEITLSKHDQEELNDYLLQLTSGFNRPVLDAWQQKYKPQMKHN